MKDNLNNSFSKLLIITTENAELKKEFENNGAVSFIVHGDLIIFESWNEDDSSIIIYNYKKGIVTDTLSIPGGCGLNYIKSEYIGY